MLCIGLYVLSNVLYVIHIYIYIYAFICFRYVFICCYKFRYRFPLGLNMFLNDYIRFFIGFRMQTQIVRKQMSDPPPEPSEMVQGMSNTMNNLISRERERDSEAER